MLLIAIKTTIETIIEKDLCTHAQHNSVNVQSVVQLFKQSVFFVFNAFYFFESIAYSIGFQNNKWIYVETFNTLPTPPPLILIQAMVFTGKNVQIDDIVEIVCHCSLIKVLKVFPFL